MCGRRFELRADAAATQAHGEMLQTGSQPVADIKRTIGHDTQLPSVGNGSRKPAFHSLWVTTGLV